MKKTVGFLAIIFTTLIACQKEDTEFVQLSKPDVTFSEFTDERDSNVYKCITIGGQTWMAENLRYRIPGGVINGCLTYDEDVKVNVPNNLINTQFDRVTLCEEMQSYMFPFLIIDVPGLGFFPPFFSPEEMAEEFFMMIIGGRVQDGTSIQTIMHELKTDPNSPWFVFEPHEKMLDSMYTTAYNEARIKAAYLESDRLTNLDYAAKHGYFYHFSTINQALPKGWRLPSDEDWKILEKNLGMDPSELDLMEEWRGAGVGTLLKEGPDGIGFNAQLNGGSVFGTNGVANNYMRQGINAYYWTSTLTNTNDTTSMAITRTLQVYQNKILRGMSYVIGDPAYNIRCIKMKDGEVIEEEKTKE